MSASSSIPCRCPDDKSRTKGTDFRPSCGEQGIPSRLAGGSARQKGSRRDFAAGSRRLKKSFKNRRALFFAERPEQPRIIKSLPIASFLPQSLVRASLPPAHSFPRQPAAKETSNPNSESRPIAIRFQQTRSFLSSTPSTLQRCLLTCQIIVSPLSAPRSPAAPSISKFSEIREIDLFTRFTSQETDTYTDTPASP